MKQLLQFFMLWLIGLMATSLQAQTWTASAVGEGTFYLYSVSEGKFITAGTTNSTRASLTTQGGVAMTFTAVDQANNVYSISTAPTFNDNLTMGIGNDGNEAYLDVAASATNASNWKFIPVEGQDNTYFIQSVKNSKYMVAHATKPDRTSVTSTTQPTTNKGYWKLVTKEALIENLSNATEETPIDATFALMNPFFAAYGRISLWGTDYTGYNGVTDNKCIEQFNRTFDMYQTITGLPNGVYKMQCQGFYRMGGRTNAKNNRNSGTETLNAKYYINTTEGSLMSIFDDNDATGSYKDGYNENTAYAVDGGANHYLPNSLNQASNCFLAGYYRNEPIRAVVTDGTIKIGFRKTVTVGDDWAAYDNVTLTYCGIDLSALVASYEEQLAKAKALLSEPMQASVKSALDAAVTTAETDVNTDSQEWLESTLSTLGTAITNAQTSNDLYTGAILTAVNGMKAQSTSESVKSALQTKYDKGEYTSAADVYAIYQPLEIAALSRDANTSYTSAIINPSFELGNMDGWNCLTTGNDTGVHHTDNATYSYSGTDGDYLFNSWATSVKTLDVGQTVTGLPSGYYSLSAVVASFGDGAAVTMTANGTSASVHPTDAGNVDGHKTVGYTLTVDNIFVSDGTLSFRVQNTGKGKTLLKADHFQLILANSYVDNYTDLTLELNVENGEVASYLINTTYTESTASVIGNYSTDAVLRNDQPNTVMIPLPEQAEDATLSLALNSSYTDAESFTLATGTVLYEVKNLLPQQTYYYKVEASGDVVANGTISTTGQLRMIKADGIANMRDLGGWTNADGNRIRYGKLFRGSELRGGKTYTASDADLAMLKNQLHIGAEVDLREEIDFASGTMNASAIDGASYYYANLSRWSEDALNFDNAKFKSAFDLILAALKADKAAYFHCIFGADRTGCFAMLLEGLLGLPVDQLYKDYELTSFSILRDKTGIDHKLQYIKALQGDNLQQKFYNYWRGAVGVSETDLNDFINIMVDGTSPITTAELADLSAKAVADGEYYIYLPAQDKFLGRGHNFGTQGVPDNYGVPAQVTTNGAGVTTIQFLDNNLYLGSDGMTDKQPHYNTVSWMLETYNDNLVMRSHNGYYLYMKDGTRAYVDAASAANADAVTFKSRTEHDALVAATQNANILAAATAAGITATDLSDFNAQLSKNYTALPSTATIKSATAGSTTNWALSEPNAHGETANYGNAYNVGSYGGELYQKNASVSQTVTVPHAGLYKLTLNAFYRQGSKELCYAAGQKGFEMSNAYVSVNGTYFAQIPSWYSGAVSMTDPDNTTQAAARFNAGQYKVEVYAYIDDTKSATITINVPGFTPWAWCIFNNFALTEYAKKVTLNETDTDAPETCDFADVTLNRTITEGFNTLCLPFSLTAEEVQAAFGDDVKVYTLTDETETGLDTYTLNFTEGTAITANMPAIISGVSSEKVASSYTFTGVTIAPSLAPTSSTEHFDFIGTYTATTIPIGDYFLKKGSSEIVKSVGNTIKGFRAYIASKTLGEVKAFSLTFEDETDAIGSLTPDPSPKVEGSIGEWYDLSGRKINTPSLGESWGGLTPGLYIISGKKVLVK